MIFFHHGVLGQSQAVFKDSGPVCNAVIAVPRQHVVIEDGFGMTGMLSSMASTGYFASAFT